MGRFSLANALAGFGLVAFLAVPAAAQAPASEIFSLKMGYDGRLYVKVLDFSLDETIGANDFSAKVKLVTSGVLAVFYRRDLDAETAGRMIEGRAQPGAFTYQNHDGKRNRRVNSRWTGEDVVTAASPAYDFLGDPPASKAQKLSAADPLTQLVRIALAGAAEGPCAGDTRFFDGKQFYELDFTNARPVKLAAGPTKLGLVNGVRCDLQYREIAGYKRKKEGEERNEGLSKIAVDFAQVGATGPWVIARMQGPTKLGDAVIELARLRVSGKRPQP